MISNIFKYVQIITLLACGCKNGKDIEQLILKDKDWLRDPSLDETIQKVIPGVSCLFKEYRIVFSNEFEPNDENQIMIIPFTTTSKQFTSPAYSDIRNRYIFVQPYYIRSFVHNTTLIDSSSIDGVLTLILVHELGHFVLNEDGAFDRLESNEKNSTSRLGEINFGTEPQIMNKQKRVELSVDSFAMSVVKQQSNSSNLDCFFTCAEIQRILPGMEFILFGQRTVDGFGSRTKDFLKDNSHSHPNMELRLAFMNYYLFPTQQRKESLNYYLYQREIEPLNKQLSDPAIHQGLEKIYP